MWGLVLATSVSFAQDIPVPDIDTQHVHPSIDSHRTIWTDLSGDRVTGFRPTGRLSLAYTNQPFVVFWSEDGAPPERTPVIRDAAQLNLLGGLAYDRLRLGLQLPVHLATAGPLLETGGAGLGDIRVDLRGTILPREDAPIGLAVAAKLSLPTATTQVPVGADGIGYEISAIVDREVGPVMLAANLAHRGVPRAELDNLVWGDQFVYRLGAGYPITEDTGVSLDLSGALTYASIASSAANPAEALVGGWHRLWQDLYLEAGVGTGLTAGIGAPRFRALAALAYRPPVENNADTDLDGVLDTLDHCVDTPEDMDGWQDEDGCPEDDNDGDGLTDMADPCPLEAEDFDDWEDEDGCPDEARSVLISVVDPDGNQIAGAEAMLTASIIDVPVTPNQNQDVHPGEYTLSAFAQGYNPATSTLRVELAAELLQTTIILSPNAPVGTLSVRIVNAQDESLPARISIDGGAFMDAPLGQLDAMVPAGPHEVRAEAPAYATALTNIDVETGATATVQVTLQPSQATLTGERIEINESVYFETGASTIMAVSYRLLDEVAVILRDHPEIARLRIEGHTDNRGATNTNQALSQARAESVREYLTTRGVDASRLNAIGFGETQPLDDRELPEAWERNRRVDFFIEKRTTP